MSGMFSEDEKREGVLRSGQGVDRGSWLWETFCRTTQREDTVPRRAPVGGVPLFDPAEGTTLMQPEVDAPGYWVGAPALWMDEDQLYLSVRHRRPPEDGRGWKSTIYQVHEGIRLEEIWTCSAEQLGTASIERSALVHIPDGAWRYYISYVDPADSRWRIDVLEADSIAGFDVDRRIPVLDAGNTFSEGVKDPVVLLLDGLVYLFAGYGPRDQVAAGTSAEQLHGDGNVFTTGLVPHPTGMWVSPDGHRFGFEREFVTPGAGWDSNVTRVSTIMPTDAGFLVFYDGRTSQGDVYEDRTGLVFSQELSTIERHSDHQPLLEGHAGTRCLRYMDYAVVGGDLLYVYETSTESGGHELRANRVPLR